MACARPSASAAARVSRPARTSSSAQEWSLGEPVAASRVQPVGPAVPGPGHGDVDAVPQGGDDRARRGARSDTRQPRHARHGPAASATASGTDLPGPGMVRRRGPPRQRLIDAAELLDGDLRGDPGAVEAETPSHTTTTAVPPWVSMWKASSLRRCLSPRSLTAATQPRSTPRGDAAHPGGGDRGPAGLAELVVGETGCAARRAAQQQFAALDRSSPTTTSVG